MSDGTEADGQSYSVKAATSSPQAAFHKVRDKDHAVLACIRQGNDTVRAINERTVDALTQDHINYAFRKLEELDLIMVQQREGWTTSVLENGETRRHRKSKQAALTERGMAYFDWKGREADLGIYDADTMADLRTRVADLEAEQNTLVQEVQKIKQILRQFLFGQDDQRLVPSNQADDD